MDWLTGLGQSIRPATVNGRTDRWAPINPPRNRLEAIAGDLPIVETPTPIQLAPAVTVAIERARKKVFTGSS